MVKIYLKTKKKMKITVKNNFSLDKLSRNVKKAIDETLEEVGSLAINSMQNTINSKGFGRYEPLSDVRIKQRKSGVGFPDNVRGVSNLGGDIPLKQTMDLYNSMEYVKGAGIEMNDYGIIHNDGLTDPQYKKKPMPARPFIDIGLEKTNLDNVETIFVEKIEKHLRK